jgi:hypothetical protein
VDVEQQHAFFIVVVDLAVLEEDRPPRNLVEDVALVVVAWASRDVRAFVYGS